LFCPAIALPFSSFSWGKKQIPEWPSRFPIIPQIIFPSSLRNPFETWPKGSEPLGVQEIYAIEQTFVIMICHGNMTGPILEAQVKEGAV
jgi:hypothetical protein